MKKILLRDQPLRWVGDLEAVEGYIGEDTLVATGRNSIGWAAAGLNSFAPSLSKTLIDAWCPSCIALFVLYNCDDSLIEAILTVDLLTGVANDNPEASIAKLFACCHDLHRRCWVFVLIKVFVLVELLFFILLRIILCYRCQGKSSYWHSCN